MRILMVTPRFGGVSGVGTAVKGLTQALTALGHVVDVLHIAPGRTSAVTLVDHAGWHRRPRPLEAVLEWDREFDVVHFHGDACSDGRDGGFSRLCRRHPVPAVVTLHSLAHEYQTAAGASPWRTMAQEAIQADMVERASAVVLLTGTSRVEMMRRCPERTRAFRVVGNGVAAPGPRPAGWGWLRRDLGWGPEHKVILFLGRLCREKGVEALAEAFVGLHRELPATRLVLAGPQVDESIQRLETVLADAGMRREAEYVLMGAVDPGTRAGLLADAAVVVLPSLTEQLPMVALEAMAHGRPCVVSALPSLVEAFRLDNSGERLALPIVLPPAPEAIRRALREALGAPEIPAMVERARRAAQQRFTWQRAAAATLEVYQSLLSGDGDCRGRPRTVGRRVAGQLYRAVQSGAGASPQDISDLGLVLLNFKRESLRARGGARERESLRRTARLVWSLGQRDTAHRAEIAVIIPVFLSAPDAHGRRYLGEAVASVCRQDLAGEVVVLVVDDGSAVDVKATLAAAFPTWSGVDGAPIGDGKGARVSLHVRRLTAHTGHPGFVRLEGYQWASRTRTPYVAHLDADDLMLPHRLRVLRDHLETHASVDLVHAAHLSIDSAGRPLDAANDMDAWYARWRAREFGLDPAREELRGRHHRHAARELRSLARGANFIHNATVLIRTEALLRLGEEALVPAVPPGREDHELWIKLARLGDVDYLNEVVGLYRRHAGNLSAPGRAR